MFTSAISCPVTFEVTSGEILYGQAHCVLEGSDSPEVDGVNGPVPRPGHAPQQVDALSQSRLRYRVPAPSGTWSTSKIFTHVPTETRKKPVPAGFIIHHSLASPVEYLRRVAAVGVSEGNHHQDREIRFVGAQEWGYAHGSRATINQAFGTQRPYDSQELDALRMGRIIILDSSAVDDFRESLQRTCLEREIYTMSAGRDGLGHPYGVHLPTTAKATKAGPRKEEESAWLCFSGNEVVAIVYDPTSAFSKALVAANPTSFMLDDNSIGPLIEEEDTSIDMDDADDSDFEEADTSELLASDGEEEEDSDEDMETERRDLGVHSMYKDPTSLAASLPPPSIVSVTYTGQSVLNVKGDTLLFANGAVAGGLAAEVSIVTNYEVNLLVAPGVVGHVEVFVTTPSGVSNSLMTQVPPVAVATAVEPSTGPVWGGGLVTLTGYNLDRTTAVLFGDISALEVQTRSSTEIAVILPAGDLASDRKATTLPICLKSDYEALPVPQQFRYNHQSAPTDPTYTHALATWRNAHLMRPNDLTPYKCLDRIFLLLSDHTSRIELWRNLEDKASGETRLYALRSLAAAHVSRNDLASAVASWEKAVALGDDDRQVYEGLIGAYESWGKQDLADKLRQEVRMTLN